MLSLSAVAILEKNKLASGEAWLLLLEAQLPGYTLRVVRNNEDITWPAAGGNVYTAFPFEIDDKSEDRQETPQLSVRVSNINRVVQGYIEAANGGAGATVILRVVLSEHLDQVTPEIEETFIVTGVKCDAEWVTFTLGTDGLNNERFPMDRHMKDFCRFRFKGIECAYNGGETECNHTLARCRELGNSVRFGGEPALPTNRYG